MDEIDLLTEKYASEHTKNVQLQKDILAYAQHIQTLEKEINALKAQNDAQKSKNIEMQKQHEIDKAQYIKSIKQLEQKYNELNLTYLSTLQKILDIVSETKDKYDAARWCQTANTVLLAGLEKIKEVVKYEA